MEDDPLVTKSQDSDNAYLDLSQADNHIWGSHFMFPWFAKLLIKFPISSSSLWYYLEISYEVGDSIFGSCSWMMDAMGR